MKGREWGMGNDIDPNSWEREKEKEAGWGDRPDDGAEPSAAFELQASEIFVSKSVPQSFRYRRNKDGWGNKEGIVWCVLQRHCQIVKGPHLSSILESLQSWITTKNTPIL